MMATLVSYYSSDGEERRCDAKCYGAKNPECRCICAGANHGKGFTVALEQTQRLAHAWIERYNAEHPGAEVHLKSIATQLALLPSVAEERWR